MSRRLAWLTIFGVAAGLYLMFATLWVGSQAESLGFDILLVRSAGERLLAGELIYPDPSGASFIDPGPRDFYGPPALAVLGVLLVPVPPAVVQLAVFPISWLVFAVGLGALAGTVTLRRDEVAAVLIGAMLAFAVFWGATLGASSVWLFGLLAGASVALARRSDLVGGALIGTSAVLRIYPVVLLIPLVVGRRWQAVVAAAVAIVFWLVIGIVAVGVDETLTFVELVRSLQGVDAGTSNVALDGFARYLSLAAGFVVLVWVGLRVRRAENPKAEVFAWAMAFAGMLLVTPVVWDHYTTALLPLVVALVATIGWPAAGLLSIGMLPASQAGGLIIVWLPLLGAVIAWRTSRILIG